MHVNYQLAKSACDNVTQKATAALMQCKRAVGPMWGLSPKTCKWIYPTVVRPILSYSATVWVRTLDNKNNLKKLERVQALALRIITGAFPSTPFNSLNHLTETPHIGCYLKGEAAKGAARLQGYNDWTVETAPSVKGTIKSHSHINNNFLASLPQQITHHTILSTTHLLSYLTFAQCSKRKSQPLKKSQPHFSTTVARP